MRVLARRIVHVFNTRDFEGLLELITEDSDRDEAEQIVRGG